MSEQVLSPEHLVQRQKSRRMLIVLALICVTPVVLSYVIFYFFPPDARGNYGQLLALSPLPESPLLAADGTALTREQLHGKWTFVVASGGLCDSDCSKALYYTRQVRTAMADKQARVARLWLIEDAAPVTAEIKDQPDLLVGRSTDVAWSKAFPGTGTRIYLVDSMGNIMMRYPPVAELDGKKMMKDLSRLLKYARY